MEEWNKTVEKWQELIEKGQYILLREELNEENPANVAEFLEELPADKQLFLFRLLSKDMAAEAFSFLDNDTQEMLVTSITDTEVRNIVDNMYLDDTIDFLEEAPANLVSKVLRNTDRETRALINRFLHYPENSAGSLMTVEFVHLSKTMTAKRAMEIIRKNGLDKETIYGWWPTYAFNSAATAIFGTYSIFERTYGPTNQFLNVYAANDLRIQPNQFFHWDYTNPDNGKTWTAPKDACGCWFWYDEDALLNSGRSTKDRDIYRYAEALLDAAESIAQSQGVTAEAAGYLAQVKARANMEGKTVAAITADLQKLGKQAFIEECWTERLREFPLEFKIWDDCLRTGKFPVISSTEKGKVTYVDLVGAKNASGATFKSSDLLWPISLNEMQRNPSLTQNEGYAVQ